MSTLEPWLAPPPEPRQKNSTWHRAISLPADDRVSRCVSSLCSWFYGVLWPYGPGSRSARMHETRPRRPEVGIGARDALVEPGAHVRQASVGVPARRGPVCSVLGVELEGRPVPEGLSNACCRARSARSTESSRWVPAAAQPGGLAPIRTPTYRSVVRATRGCGPSGGCCPVRVIFHDARLSDGPKPPTRGVRRPRDPNRPPQPGPCSSPQRKHTTGRVTASM